MALSFDDVLDSLKKANVEPDKAKIVLATLKAAELERKEEAQEEKQANPKKKNQFVGFVMDDGTLTNKELIGYVIQVPEDKDPKLTFDAFKTAVRSYNTGTRKGRKYPITKVGEGMMLVKGKHLKDGNGGKIVIKTKEPIQIFPIKNEIDNPTQAPLQPN